MVYILLEIWLMTKLKSSVDLFMSGFTYKVIFYRKKCRNIPELQLVNGEDWLL